MEFTFSLQRVVEDFNQSLIEFDLVLRVGEINQSIHLYFLPLEL